MADKTFHSITLPGTDPARIPDFAQEFNTGTAYKVKDIFDTKTSGTVYFPKRIPPEVTQSFALRISGNAPLVPKITLYYVPCYVVEAKIGRASCRERV